ncbi:hypothetical protein MC885_008193 [Smutsia gigantea]|nr:hypothetical protein MC885_008193 [Smutsia gigantea]
MDESGPVARRASAWEPRLPRTVRAPITWPPDAPLQPLGRGQGDASALESLEHHGLGGKKRQDPRATANVKNNLEEEGA